MKKNSYSAECRLFRICAGHSKILKKSVALLLLVILAGGCKKVIEEPGVIGICPIVISTSPGDTSTGISVNTLVDATFNEAMNPSSITSTTFTLQHGTTAVAGLVTYSGVIATFSPSA